MHSDNILLLLSVTLTVMVTVTMLVGVSWLGLPPLLEVMITSVLTFVVVMVTFVKISGLDRPLYNK